jgi:uncharacterized protein
LNVHLLDVNVLVALLWPAHEHHDTALAWFGRHVRHGWATTPITQAGFVRIVSNPAFSKDAISPGQAIELLRLNLGHPQHRFWPADTSIDALVQPFAGRLVGHRQVTDACLLGLAARHGGKLATFDRGVAELLADAATRTALVTLIA